MTASDPRLRSIHSLIIDIDGVLWHGNSTLPGVPGFFAFLREHAIRFVIATNNSARLPDDIISRLAGMGVPVDPSSILTSAGATAMYLARHAQPGARVLLVGGPGLAEAMVDAGYHIVDTDADFVVAGLDTDLTYDKLKRAALEIRRGARFIGTNPDPTLPTSEGLVPGAGAILQAIKAATGIPPTVIGKPEKAMFDLAIEKMHGEPATTAMLGDRLETDIEGAQRAGLVSILVLTGVTSRELLSQSPIQPAFVFQDLDALTQAWEFEFEQQL